MVKRKEGEEFKRKITAYALANALTYGKAKLEAVLSKLFQEGLKKEQLKEIIPIVQETIEKVNALSSKAQQKQFQKLKDLVKKRQEQQEQQLPPLPKAEGKVIMRIAPFPSGPLHLGNARAFILNDNYCKRYEGKLYLVIDDTIGSEEKQILPEAYELIPEGLDWLGVCYEKPIIYKSDRLEIYYRFAEELIKKEAAYVCFCDAEKLHRLRQQGLECEHRKASVEENLRYWHAMLEGNYKPGKAILRIKTDMKHKNPAFRDRVLFRISSRAHPRTGLKYRVWPMLEFSWAIDDHLLGITHIMRGKELMMESEMERYIWDIFGWSHPVIIHTGLIKLEGAKISKSKAREEIISKKYFGWDDPRTWSLQSLKRRGFRPEAIRAFCLSLGLTERETTIPIENLYKENRKFLELSNRYFFIANPVKITIKGAPRIKAKLPLHPDHPERGNRNLTVKQSVLLASDDVNKIVRGKPYRLMNLLNFIKNDYYEFISEKLDPKLKAKLLHWLPSDPKQTISCEVLMPDGNFVSGVAERAVATLKLDTTVQFERFGFCRLDAKTKDKVVFWFSHK